MYPHTSTYFTTCVHILGARLRRTLQGNRSRALSNRALTNRALSDRCALQGNRSRALSNRALSNRALTDRCLRHVLIEH